MLVEVLAAIHIITNYTAACSSLPGYYHINSLRPSDAYMRQLSDHQCSVNGLSPGQRQAIIWTNVGLLLIGPLGTNISETLINIQTFSFRNMHLKKSSGKWRPYCLGLNVLINLDWNSRSHRHMKMYKVSNINHHKYRLQDYTNFTIVKACQQFCLKDVWLP